jgi:RND superfamily putative drug exporter
MNAAFAALGRIVVKLRWVILVAWLVGTVLAVHSLPSLGSQVNNNNSSFLPASAPSNQAATLAVPLIGSTNQSQIPVVAVTSNAALNAADQAALIRAQSELAKVASVDSVHFLATRGDAAQLLVVSSVTPFDQTGTDTLVSNLQTALGKSGFPPDLQVHLAGEIATNVANQKASNKAGSRIQSFSILFIIVLLFIIFRAFLAPLVTLIPAVMVLLLSGSFIGALGAHGLKISFFTQILLIVLILGAGTDYGLFLVFRVREEMLNGREPKDAVAYAVSKVGESIAASAATVVVALLTLTLATFGIYHDLGIPLAIGIVVMLLAGLTLLPALLAILGRAVFWPTKTAPKDHKEGLWGRIAGRLVRRPALTLCVGVLVFAALAVFAAGFKPGGFGGQVNAPAGSSAALGNTALTTHFPQASANPTNIIMRFPTSAWSSAAALASSIGKATTGLEGTGSFTTLAGALDPNGEPITPAELYAVHTEIGKPAQELVRTAPVPPAGSSVSPALYDAYLASARYLSADGRTAQWEAGLKAGDPQSSGALDAIPTIRSQVAVVGHEAGASAAGVAGEAPALYDVSHISDSDLRHIVPIAVLAIGIVLALVLRSLVAPLYLILSVVLSYLASLGLAVIVFIKIGGNGGIVFLLPFLMFIFLLALGEDYNILVMTRIREEATNRPLREAVVRAVGTTGPTVTSAGLVLAGTFAVLAIAGGSGSGGSQVREIGVGLAVGILLDTFVVRTVLVPSTVSLLGRWNWWPSAMSRRSVGVSGGQGPPSSPGGGGNGVPPVGPAPQPVGAASDFHSSEQARQS